MSENLLSGEVDSAVKRSGDFLFQGFNTSFAVGFRLLLGEPVLIVWKIDRIGEEPLRGGSLHKGFGKAGVYSAIVCTLVREFRFLVLTLHFFVKAVTSY